MSLRSNLNNEKQPIFAQTELDKALAKSFHLQISGAAIDSYKSGDYLKSALLSWSYIEEYYLPTTINHIVGILKVKIDKDLVEKSNSYQLIRYYLLVSHDREMFEILEKARKLRNEIIHGLMKSGNIEDVHTRAKKCAYYNLHEALNSMLDREDGKVIAPSLLIAVNARNDLRAEMRERLEKL